MLILDIVVFYEFYSFQESSSEDPSRIVRSRGSVEIVEVSLTEDEESEKELNKSQIEDIVHTTKPPAIDNDNQIPEREIQTIEIGQEQHDLESTLKPSQEETDEKPKVEPLEEETTTWTTTTESKESAAVTEDTSEISDATSELKKELNLDIEQPSSETTIGTPEFSEDLFNEIEIKVDLINNMKRDYSRAKKKEDQGRLPISFLLGLSLYNVIDFKTIFSLRCIHNSYLFHNKISKLD